MTGIKKIDTAAVSRLTGKPGIRLVDVRPVDAYNGWRLRDEARGGHIPGAKSLPSKWAHYIDWIETVRHKNILPGVKIILYGYEDDETELVAGRFSKAGFSDLSVYRHFTDEWVRDESLPMDRLDRYPHLVPAVWVYSRIKGLHPEHHGNNHLVLLHTHYRNRDAYLSGHIPGAIDIDTLAVEAPGMWNRRSPGELKSAFEEHGITAHTTVVVYGKYLEPDTRDLFPGSAAGDIGAMRVASILMYAGVKDVRILNGGFQSWMDEGYEISYFDEPKKPVAEFGCTIPARPELIIDLPEAKELLASPDAGLVCVRSRPEYLGEISGYNYINAKGRIPGSIFADCGSDAYHMENYRNLDHTCREFHEIRGIWARSGITPDLRLAFYCGTGWRGSEAWFNAWLMGWPRVSVFDGGWLEWSSDPSNPVETGISLTRKACEVPLRGSHQESGEYNPFHAMNVFPIHELDTPESNGCMIREICDGLCRDDKFISSRFFYDQEGSELFDQITTLSEYYLTQTELSILRKCAGSIIGDFETLDLVELGSGNCTKISVLLDTIPANKIRNVRYFPIDISRHAMERQFESLTSRYPGLKIEGVIADFMTCLDQLPGNSGRLICFFGSTIGNMSHSEVIAFLARMKKMMGCADKFVVGMDMVKDPGMLRAAYNDRHGLTSRFNRNILKAVNHIAGTDFNPARFHHLAIFNQTENRIEMYLEADSDMEVTSDFFPENLRIRKGERIHTENSHKYTPENISDFALRSGLKIEKIYTDPNQWFSLVEFTC